MLLSLKANLEIAIAIITRIIGRSIIFIVFLVMIIVITVVMTIMVIIIVHIIVMWLNLHKRAAVVAGFDWREPALLIFQLNLSGGL